MNKTKDKDLFCVLFIPNFNEVFYARSTNPMSSKGKNKKFISSQTVKPMYSFEDMERWFDEFLPTRFMHPFNDH